MPQVKPCMLRFSAVIAVVVLGMSCFDAAMAELPRLEHHPVAEGSLSFLVVGDWGRNGQFNQSLVALQMGKLGEKLNIEFTVSTGDNFYDDGLTGVEDPQFQDSFSNIYTAPSLQKQWYNVLGNHDYRGDVKAQLSPILTQRDSRWVCMRSYILDAEIADFFFVDTTPFLKKYFTDPEGHVYDWSGVLPRKAYLSNLLRDVDSALKASTAKWKIVVGHHTIKSIGRHGDTVELVARLLPVLLENDVDLYLNGHDHCLEQISSIEGPIQFLTSGGGSKAWKGDVGQLMSPDQLKFYYDGQGFMGVQIFHSQLQVQFYDVFGNVLHKWAAYK